MMIITIRNTKQSNRKMLAGIILSVSILSLTGCGSSETPTATQMPDGAKYILATQPEGAINVGEFRKSAIDGDDVVVNGRIGGDANPWIEGMAAFLITDTSLVPCNERPGDGCSTPWDYCCDLNVLKDMKVLVKIVDKDGNAVAADAKKLLGMEELQYVTAVGRTEKDADGTLRILASKIFIRQ